MAPKLGAWLGTLSPDQLTGILTRRPDVLAPPVPGSIRELADRLQSRASVVAAFQGLPRPAVQVIETLQSLGGPTVAVADLAAAFGRTPDDPDLAAILRVLSLRALVWGDGELRMAGPLWSAFSYPLHLGPPAARLFSARTADELRRVATTLGLAPARAKQHLVEQIVALLADRTAVASLLSVGPDPIRDLLQEIAWEGPVVRSHDIIYGYGHSANPVLDWALSRGLLVADGWQAAVMPAEVGRSVRGPEWLAPFTPQPPEPALVPADPAAVEREAAAAAGPAVAAVTAVLECCAATPIALLKAGGVGARELRRLAKAVGDEEVVARLWVEVAVAAGLATTTESGVLPTGAYDEWRKAEPAGRLVPLLGAWWRLRAAPFSTTTAALVATGYGDTIVELRHELLRAARDLPEGSGVAAQDGLVPVVGWRAPLLAGSLDEPEHMLVAAWLEAQRLGLVAHGTLSSLGRALVDGEDAAPAAAALLPPAVATALFQADLTAVVPGTPSGELASLLDSAADRESGGGATSWRFSPASVRRALDAGTTLDGLLDALRAVSTGDLPQPLAYLVADVARRHGRVRVRPVACVLRSDDTALLTEIAAVRALAPLGLVAVAPTVLTSTQPLAETLVALRAAGYAPVAESDDGTAVVERTTRHRAGEPRTRRVAPVPRTRRPSPADGDPREVAVALLAARGRAEPEPADPPPASTPLTSGETAATIAQHAPQLSGGEQRILGYALEHHAQVQIHYVNANGNESTRVIEPTAISGRLLEAWCHLRDDERMFSLDRIEGVAPV